MNIREFGIFTGQVILILIFVYLVGITVGKPKMTEAYTNITKDNDDMESEDDTTLDKILEEIESKNINSKKNINYNDHKETYVTILSEIIESENLWMLERIKNSRGVDKDIDQVVKRQKYKESVRDTLRSLKKT